jgi:hypothetical protein
MTAAVVVVLSEIASPPTARNDSGVSWLSLRGFLAEAISLRGALGFFNIKVSSFLKPGML